MPLLLPHFVMECLTTLNGAGYEAWCVGGCVRDLLLGRTPHDFDVTTNAHPEEIAGLFPRHFETGLRFGTITAQLGQEEVEITTYRVEGAYKDHRRPEELRYATTLREDVSRRDFTMNAMAYHPTLGLRDYFSGNEDISKRIIRTVGEPALRFQEDALRILRAFRFSCQLDFDIEPETLAAALEQKESLSHISPERITAELCRALETERPSRLSPFFQRELQALDGLPKDLPLRLASLCFLLEEAAPPLLCGLRLSAHVEKETRQTLTQLSLPLPEDKAEFKRRFDDVSPKRWHSLLLAYHKIRKEDTQNALRFLKEIQEFDEPWRLSQLAVSGADLIAAGISPGKELGRRLASLLEEVRRNPQANEREYLLALL